MKVWIDFQDDDRASTEHEVDVVPRIGEKVGSRPLDGGPEGAFCLDFVVDVRHYVSPSHEIRVLTSSRP